jgi:hypothetical protein
MIIECSTTVGTWLNLDGPWLRVIRIERVLHVPHLTPMIELQHVPNVVLADLIGNVDKYAA